jgi:PAS domain S-box-containing protein
MNEDVSTKINHFIDNTLVSLIVVTNEGQIGFINPAGERMFGYHSREVTGQSLSTLFIFSGKSDREILQHLRYCCSKGRCKARMLSKDGTAIQVAISVKETQDAGDWCLTIRDLPELPSTKLMYGEEATRKVVTAPLSVIGVVGLITATQEGQIEFSNRGVERLFGYRKDEIVGHDLSMFFVSPSKAGSDLIEHLMNCRSKLVGTKMLRKDGTLIPVEMAVFDHGTAGDGRFVINMTAAFDYIDAQNWPN